MRRRFNSSQVRYNVNRAVEESEGEEEFQFLIGKVQQTKKETETRRPSFVSIPYR